MFDSISFFIGQGIKRFGLSSFFKLSVAGFDRGNTIKGGAKIGKVGQVRFRGQNNKLILGSHVVLENVRIHFQGDNATVVIGDNSIVNGKFVLHSGCMISIGADTKFNNGALKIRCGESDTSVRIGRGCLLADVKMRTSDQHSVIDIETGGRINPAQDIIIGDRVWIAENVFLYKGARIGSGSVVGARSTVTGELPENSLCVGTPAKAIKAGVTWCDEPMPVSRNLDQ